MFKVNKTTSKDIEYVKNRTGPKPDRKNKVVKQNKGKLKK